MRQFLLGVLAGAALVGLGTIVPSFGGSLLQGAPEAGQRLPRHIVSDLRDHSYDLASLDSMAAQMDFATIQDLIEFGRPVVSLQRATQDALLAGASSISVVAESYGGCNRVLQIIHTPNGGDPEVVSRTSGHCEARPAGRLPRISVSGVGDESIAIPRAISVTAAQEAVL